MTKKITIEYRFFGEWEEDVKVRGHIVYRDDVKDYYDGELKDDQPHGNGIMKFSSGSEYDGSWNKNNMHGLGEYRNANGQIYKGIYANNKKNGIFLLWGPNGDLYQGRYKDDKRDGLHIIQLKATGNTGYAEFQDDLREGFYAQHR